MSAQPDILTKGFIFLPLRLAIKMVTAQTIRRRTTHWKGLSGFQFSLNEYIMESWCHVAGPLYFYTEPILLQPMSFNLPWQLRLRIKSHNYASYCKDYFIVVTFLSWSGLIMTVASGLPPATTCTGHNIFFETENNFRGSVRFKDVLEDDFFVTCILYNTLMWSVKYLARLRNIKVTHLTLAIILVTLKVIYSWNINLADTSGAQL